MDRKWQVSGLVLAALLVLPVASFGGGWLRAPLSETAASSAAVRQTLAYGSLPTQQLDIWTVPAGDRPAPLVMFVHGGAWMYGNRTAAASRWLPAHLTRQGYAYASIDYRLVPDVTVEAQVEDVVQALEALLDRATELGIDRGRVVLMGHSAGAHLAALVGTDERYLKAAGLSFADLSGVIANDGAAYDVPAQMREHGRIMQRTYATVFGNDPARQRALSPTYNAAAPNARAFLLLHVERPDGVRQADALGRALAAAGTAVEYGRFSGKGLLGHIEINRKLGDPDHAATAVMDAWFRKIFAK